MNNIYEDFDDAELERRFRLETWQAQLKRGLISRDHRWFRCSAYEIQAYHGHFFIRPSRGASLEFYSPFEHTTEILTDLYTLLNQLHPLFLSYHYQLEGGDNRDSACRRAELLLRFINKYGPLGIYFERLLFIPIIQGSDNLIVYVKATHYYQRYIRYLHYSTPGAFLITNLLESALNGAISWEAYNNLFFPWEEVPYGSVHILPSEDETKNPFRLNYAEHERFICHNDLFANLISSYRKHLLLTGNTVLTMPLEYQVGGLPLISFFDDSMPIELSENYSLSLVRENNTLKIAWRANSLLEILMLMHAMNIVGQLAENVRICRLQECAAIITGKRYYCCDRHAATDRQRRKRQRDKG